MNEKNVSVTMKKRLQKYALTGIKIAILVLLCFVSANFIGPESKYVFLVNVIASSAILYYIVRMIYKRAYAQYGKKILSAVIIVIAANHLYLYENIVQLFPVLKTVHKGTMLILLLLIFAVTFLVGWLARYISTSEGLDKMNESMGKNTVNAEKTQKRKKQGAQTQASNRLITGLTPAKVIGILLAVTAVGGALWLYFKMDLPKLISDNPIENVPAFLSSMMGYIASILFMLIAIAMIVFAFVELLRILLKRILILRTMKKNGTAEDNSALAFAFSILVVFAILLVATEAGDWTLSRIQDELVGGEYLAYPLIILVGIVVSILLLRLTYGILLLLMKPSPWPNADDLRKFKEATKIKQHIISIGQLFSDIVFGTIETVLDFVKFVPNFFKMLGALVLPSKGEENKDDTEERGVKIVTVAAFCFALVSFQATANGMINYVFTEPGQKTQAYLLSFGIQSILFVFNLKLPVYFAKIGSKVPLEERKKNRRGKYKWTGMQKIIAVFYAVVIVSSSLFSYTYIVNAVYAKTQYYDANVVLDNKYRTVKDDTQKYIYEQMNYQRLLISEQLGNLEELIPDTATSTETLESLQNKKIQAVKDLADRRAEEVAAQADFDIASELYFEPMSSHWRTADEREKEKKAYEDARDALTTAKAATSAAEQELAKIQLDIDNYKENASTVVHDFLVEMLKISPSLEDYVEDNVDYSGLSSYVKQLSDYVVNIDEDENDITNFSEIVLKTSELSISVNNYTTYVQLKLEEEEPTITVPEYGNDAYEQQIVEWEAAWKKRFASLEDVIKQLPEYTTSETSNEKKYGDVINFDVLSDFQAKEVIEEIDDLQRKNFSTINHLERAANLLFSEYPILAWFSLGLAIFLDVASLLAGLFAYYVSGKSKN